MTKILTSVVLFSLSSFSSAFAASEYQCYQISQSAKFNERGAPEHLCTLQSETRRTDPLGFRIELVSAGPMNTKVVHAVMELRMSSRSADQRINANRFAPDPDTTNVFGAPLTVEFSGKRAISNDGQEIELISDEGTVKIGGNKLYYRLAK
jgi:hypothetical protein